MKSLSLPFAAVSLILVACGGGSGSQTGSTSSDVTAQSCESSSDCDGFLPQSVEVCSDGKSAAAHWSCSDKKCAIKYCSKDETPSSSAGSNSCNQASDCTGFLPQDTEMCADGTSQGAQWDCNSNTCAISYCDNDGGLASSSGGGGSGGGGANSCNQPSDCTGFLPRNVVGCADGTSQGAQWDCDSNQCVISYCDNDGGTAS